LDRPEATPTHKRHGTRIEDDAPGAGRSVSTGARPSASQKWASIAFGGYLAVAAVLLLLRFGRDDWFAGDDWGLIVQRKLSDPSSLMQPQNDHWLLGPALITQVLYRIIGLRSYLPYQAVTVGLHLTLAALCRLVMRRAGVGPWTATVVAGTFVLFGAGYEEVFFLIMMGPLITLVFGFVQLLLADHDGTIDRRDWLGLGAGLIGISSSALGPMMVTVVGLAALGRRGWRTALFHTVPLGVVWVIWHQVWGRDTTAGRFDFDVMRNWLQIGETGVFKSIGGYPLIAAALGVLLVVGLGLAWFALDLETLRRRAAAPLALMLGGALFFVLTGSQRAFLVRPDSSRYLGWTAPLILPALGVAAYAVIARWRIIAPLILALFLVGVPRSIDTLSTNARMRADLAQRGRSFLLAAAYSPALDEVPAGVLPDPNVFRGSVVTVGFLRAAKRAGRLPADPGISDQAASTASLRLRLAQSALGEPVPDGLVCADYATPLIIDARDGAQFGINGEVLITPLTSLGKPSGPPVQYTTAWSGQVLTVVVTELHLDVESPDKSSPFRFCR
jgi:hypothetical protein